MSSPFSDRYNGRKVLITGHTGFKGSWLAFWLLELGAKVYGYALEPEPGAILFDQLGLEQRLDHQIGDVRDLVALKSRIQNVRPDIIFHLAAQPLVLRSYEEPALTYATNVMGTVNLLEAVRELHAPCAVVVITTDKVYQNREWEYGYRESDPLGGYDPYSSSKAAAELVVSAYRNAYFNKEHSPRVCLASARAGNVIGGGDWAETRLVPDCMRSLLAGETIRIRNPGSTRPWQHVLEPLSGYLWLGACLRDSLCTKSDPAQPRICDADGKSIAQESLLETAFNFGPEETANRPVRDLVNEILRHWQGKQWQDVSSPDSRHEAGQLNLSITRAHNRLDWAPVWDFPHTVKATVDWYRNVTENPSDAQDFTRRQIADYTEAAHAKALSWAL